MGLRPYISDNGANIRGPEANPSKKVVTPRVETVREHPNSSATLVMTAVCMDEQKAIVAVIHVTAQSRDRSAGRLCYTNNLCLSAKVFSPMMVHTHFLARGKFNGFSLWFNATASYIRGCGCSNLGTAMVPGCISVVIPSVPRTSPWLGIVTSTRAKVYSKQTRSR